MQAQDIYCLFKRGAYVLTPQTSVLLHFTALDMFRRSQKRKTIKGLNADVLVTTKFEQVCFVSVSGIKFKACIAGEDGVTEIEFVIRVAEVPENAIAECALVSPEIGETLCPSEAEVAGRN